MDSNRLQRMLADLAESRAELAEAFARFAAWKGDSVTEMGELAEAREFRTLAETHRSLAKSRRSSKRKSKTPEQM